MNNPWPAIIVGIALVIFGIGLLISHDRSWRRQQNDPTLDEKQRLHYHRRFRRRLQIAALLAQLGVLIAVGDVLMPMQRQPLWWSLYWIGVLLLTGWVIVLALGDLWSTSAHTRAELARARLKQRELERQVIEFKHRHLDGNDS